MKSAVFRLLILLAVSILASSNASAENVYAVTICDGCYNQQSFHDAASSAAGTGYNGIRAVYVINSVSRAVGLYYVHNTPPGQIPYGDEDLRFDSMTQEVIAGELTLPVSLDSNVVVFNDDNYTYVSAKDDGAGSREYMEGAPLRYVTDGWVSPDLKEQVGYIIDLGSNMGVVRLPSSGGFSSYLGSEHAAVSLELYHAMAAKFGATWARDAAGKQFWKMLLRALKLSKGVEYTVCALFDNGDSACYEVYPGHPSAASLVEGSQKDINGLPLPPASTGGSSGAGLNVNVNQGGTSVRYSGRWVYVTVTCVVGADGKLRSCIVQYE